MMHRAKILLAALVCLACLLPGLGEARTQQHFDFQFETVIYDEANVVVTRLTGRAFARRVANAEVSMPKPISGRLNVGQELTVYPMPGGALAVRGELRWADGRRTSYSGVIHRGEPLQLSHDGWGASIHIIAA